MLNVLSALWQIVGKILFMLKRKKKFFSDRNNWIHHWCV